MFKVTDMSYWSSQCWNSSVPKHSQLHGNVMIASCMLHVSWWNIAHFMLLSNQALGRGCLTPESQVCPWTVVLQLIQLNGRVIGYFYLFDKHSRKLESIHRVCSGCHTLDKPRVQTSLDLHHHIATPPAVYSSSRQPNPGGTVYPFTDVVFS